MEVGKEERENGMKEYRARSFSHLRWVEEWE